MSLLKNTLWICLLVCTIHGSEVKRVSLHDALQKDSSIEYIKCHDKRSFDYDKFPLSVYPQYQPHQGMFAETFVLKIPEGRVFSSCGLVQVSSGVIEELFHQDYPILAYENLIQQSNVSQQVVKKFSGRVAVLASADIDCYGFWIGNVLQRLALLEMKGIEYDWLYVQYNRPFIKETLALLGIDTAKIIEPDVNYYIQADELIVPSLAVRRVRGEGEKSFAEWTPLVMHTVDWTIDWCRKKFLPLAEKMDCDVDFSKRVFISRKNAGVRKLLNEDEVFALFEKKGFQRYYLEEMSFLQQVKLFHQAEVIVGTHGSGLTNVMFCNKNARVVELFQNQFDSTFWHISGILDLKHDCVKTQESSSDNSKSHTSIPLSIIEEFIQKNLKSL